MKYTIYFIHYTEHMSIKYYVPTTCSGKVVTLVIKLAKRDHYYRQSDRTSRFHNQVVRLVGNRTCEAIFTKSNQSYP